MVKKLIATTAGALFLVGSTASAIAAPVASSAAQRASSPVAGSLNQDSWMDSDMFWIVLFILLTLGIIWAVEDNKKDDDEAPASPG